MSDNLEIKTLLKLRRVSFPKKLMGRDFFGFVGSTGADLSIFYLRFADLDRRRIADLSYSADGGRALGKELTWIDISEERTIFRVNIIDIDEYPRIIYDVDRIVFYSSDKAFRIIRRQDEYNLEYFSLKIDRDIFL